MRQCDRMSGTGRAVFQSRAESDGYQKQPKCISAEGEMRARQDSDCQTLSPARPVVCRAGAWRHGWLMDVKLVSLSASPVRSACAHIWLVLSANTRVVTGQERLPCVESQPGSFRVSSRGCEVPQLTNCRLKQHCLRVTEEESGQKLRARASRPGLFWKETEVCLVR